MPLPSYRLEPLPGYAPTIGRLVGILLYARQTTLAAVAGLSIAQLDHLQDHASNSIGALLAHIAVVERAYHLLTFEERAPSPQEQAAWEPALTLGAEGRRLLRGKPLDAYVHELSEARRLTLEGLAARDDAWLERSLNAAPAMNAHWAWFHVAEDEINHRGQIRWLRARLGSVGPRELAKRRRSGAEEIDSTDQNSP
jgi:uncharacterized damage-inducible protein DinB